MSSVSVLMLPKPGQCSVEFLLLLSKLSSELGELSLQVGNLIVEIGGVSLEFTTVLIQLLTHFLLFS